MAAAAAQATTSDLEKSAPRGEYVARASNGIACHTYYAGWIAIDLRADHQDGLAGRSVEDLTQFFLTGRNDRTAAFGKMIEVVETSTQYLRHDDAEASHGKPGLF